MRAQAIITACLLALCLPALITDGSDGEEPEGYMVTFYDADGQITSNAVAWRTHGYIVAPEDIPPLPEGCGYYTMADPRPGGWINLTICTWDPAAPLDHSMSVYIWDASDMPPHPPGMTPDSDPPAPAPEPEPTPRRTEDPKEMPVPVLIGIGVAVAIGLLVLIIRKK